MKIVNVPVLKPGDRITITVDGQTLTAKAVSVITSGKAVLSRDQTTGEPILVGNSSEVIDKTSRISRNRPTTTQTEVYPIKLLAYRSTDDGRQYMVGGDRKKAVDVYEPITTYPNNRTIYANISNTGKKKDNWIVGLQWPDNRITPSLPERFEGSGWTINDIQSRPNDMSIIAIASPTEQIEFNKNGEFYEAEFSRFCGNGMFTIDSFKNELYQLYNNFGFGVTPSQLLLYRRTRIVNTNTIHQDNWRQATSGSVSTIIYAPSSLITLPPPESVNFLYSSEIINSAMLDDFINPTGFSTHQGIRTWFNNFALGTFQGSIESGGINSFSLTDYPATYSTAIGTDGRYYIDAIASSETPLFSYSPRISATVRPSITTGQINPIHSVITTKTTGSLFPSDAFFTYVLPNQVQEYKFTLGTRSRQSRPPQDITTSVLNVNLTIQESNQVFKELYTFSLAGYEEHLISLTSSLAIADCDFANIQNSQDILTGYRDFYIAKDTANTTSINILGVPFPVIYTLDDYRVNIHNPQATSNGVSYIQSTRINSAVFEIPYLKFMGVDGTGIVAIWRYTLVNNGTTVTDTYSERYYFIKGFVATELTDLGDFFLEGSTFTNGNYTEQFLDGFLNIYSDTSGITLKGNKLYKVDLSEEKAILLKSKKTKLNVTTYTITEDGEIVKGKTEKHEVLPIKNADEIVGASYFPIK